MTNDADPNTPDPDQDGISGLRARADQAGVLENENAQLQKELAFVRAGIDTSSDIGATLMRGYDGELTVEALKPLADQMAAMNPTGAQAQGGATQDDPLTPGNLPNADPPSPADMLDQVAGGVAPGLTPPANPIEEGWAKFRERLEGGARAEDAAAELINRIIDGAVREQKGEEGFSGFIYDQARYHEKLRGG